MHFAASAIVALTLAACAAQGDSLARPGTVISLIPSVTDFIVALGEEKRLAGRTSFDDDPRLAALPVVGGTLQPSLEAILSLDPDLVIVWSNSDYETRTRLGELGIHTLAVGTETIDEVRVTIHELGRVLGVPRAAASLRKALDDSISAVRSRSAGRPRPRIFWIVWPDPLFTAGPGTFVDELIDIAGGTNIFDDAPMYWPIVGLEAVMARDPDVVVWPRDDTSDARALLRQQPGWEQLRAIREDRIVVLPSRLVHRPGPRTGVAASRLAEALAAIHGGTR